MRVSLSHLISHFPGSPPSSQHSLHLHCVVDPLCQVARRAVVRGIDLVRVVATVTCHHVGKRCLSKAWTKRAWGMVRESQEGKTREEIDKEREGIEQSPKDRIERFW